MKGIDIMHNILVFTEIRGYLNISLEEQLKNLEYNIINVGTGINEINEIKENITAILMYLDEDLMKKQQSLVFLRDKALQNDTPIFVLGDINELSDIDIWDLANVEHNRWNMEQLLMTYSPLTKEEMFDVLHYHDKPLRNIYKGVMKHSDLCSCNQLKVYGKTFKYDVAFARDLVDNYYKVKENNKKN